MGGLGAIGAGVEDEVMLELSFLNDLRYTHSLAINSANAVYINPVSSHFMR